MCFDHIFDLAGSSGLSLLTNEHADPQRLWPRVARYWAHWHTTRGKLAALLMDAAADAPLRIGNLRSAKSDKPIVAIGIEGSANKVRDVFNYRTLPQQFVDGDRGIRRLVVVT